MMNLSPILPKTPVRTPQTGTSTKALQLTPIWEAVVKSHRIPPEVNENSVFQEISSRLGDLEWPVRQHAFRVLYDIIPIVSKDRLDERIIQNDILNKLIVNLGHPAPGVRKVAMETIRQYLKQTLYSEKMLESFVLYGVNEDLESDADEIGIVRENVILGTIVSLVDILKPFVFPENGGYSVSQPFLNKIVAILSEKMKSPLYQEKCAETLWKIRDMVGESRFLRALDHLPDKTLITLIHLRDMHEKLMAEEAAACQLKAREDNQDSDQSFEMKLENTVTTYHNYKTSGSDGKVAEWLMDAKLNRYLEESTEEYSDGTDTDTYTKETFDPNDEIKRFLPEIHPIEPEKPRDSPKGDDPIVEDAENKETLKVSDDKVSESAPSSPRVVLETEIQFSEDKAIKMTIVEDEKDSAVKENEIDLFPVEAKTSRESSAERRFVTEDGDLIMKILRNSESENYQEEERKRTPRRVRFGGEVIKLRTPDSDETDNAGDIRDNKSTNQTASRPTTAHGKVENRSRPEIKLTPPKSDQPKVEKLVIHESKPQSHIPLPISPATKSPRSRDVSPCKKSSQTKPSDEGQKPVKSPDSTTEEEEIDDDVDYWKWSEFGLVSDQVISDLKNQNEWKAQYQALEELKVILINAKAIDKIGKAPDDGKLSSLLKCLLHKIPGSNNQQVTNLSISLVFQLIQTLPREMVRRNLHDIVNGLCRYVGGCKNVSLKIESVQSLKMLFTILEPSSVINILLSDCLNSSSSKMRENALLAIMYATMTFPSNSFDSEKIVEKVVKSAADSRRRVRHAALEAISILSQFCSSETVNETVARIAESLPCNATKNGLISAVNARLARRILPTVSNDGLVLYSLQIPASRRFGAVGNPSGADVNWILSGTGSISTGSARSRGQLNAAQRLDLPVPAPFSPTKWRNSGQTLPFSNAEKTLPDKGKIENPWTKQKNRTESSGTRLATQENWKNHGNRIYKTPSTGNLTGRHRETLRFNSNDNLIDDHTRIARVYPMDLDGLRPEEMSWALVPVSSLEEQQIARIRNNQLWGEFGIENGNQYISSPMGALRPMYLKLQPTPDAYSFSRSTDDLRRSSFSYGGHRGSEKFREDDFTQIRVLTPSILREKYRNDDTEMSPRIGRSDVQESETISRIPPLHSGPTTRNTQKHSKSSDSSGNDKKLEENNIKLNGGIAQNGGLDHPQNYVVFPSIHANGNGNHEYGHQQQKSPQFNDTDEYKKQESVTQLNGFVSNGKAKKSLKNRKGDVQSFAVGKNQVTEIFPLRSGGNNKKIAEYPDGNDHANFQQKENQSPPNSVPALVQDNNREQTPSTSSSNNSEFGIINGSGIRLQKFKNGSGDKTLSDGFNQDVKGSKTGINKNNKIIHSGSPFPDSLQPFERPKEALETCFNQLESQQWESIMTGLTTLVRLLRHHPTLVQNHLHPLIMALGRQIRNLRSQVSRAACQAAAEMFTAMKRNSETDLEVLAVPLFNKTADTNRFIRHDSGQALDAMVDNIVPVRAINIIISKGATHQNAIVRMVAARLFLRVSENIGPEKLFSLPREIRDKIVQTGANFLMEGKLETRAYAKELFKVWSMHQNFSNIMLEAIPPNVMRHISKTLISLKT